MERHIAVTGTGMVGADPGPVRLRAVGAETAAIPVEPGAPTTAVRVQVGLEIA